MVGVASVEALVVAEALALLNSQSVVPCKSEDDIAYWERTSWLYSKFHDWQFKRNLNKI